MTDEQKVSLESAGPHDAALLSNLLELYSYDLSDTFRLELGNDGRFGYQNLPLYWSEPEQRFPFLIRSGTRIAGFAFAARELPPLIDSESFDVAEFFVLRRYRRAGIGRRAAFLLWNRFEARWTVRVSEGNPIARRFWARVVAEYASGLFTETTRPGSPHPWCVFSFNSVRRGSPG